MSSTPDTLGATVVAAMWRDAIAHGQMISTDATGAAIQPTKAKCDTCPSRPWRIAGHDPQRDESHSFWACGTEFAGELEGA